MKKLLKEEIPQLLPIKRKKQTKLSVLLMQLAVGEGITLDFTEWKRKTNPKYVVAYIKKTKGMRYEWGENKDGTGWLFRRVK